MNAATSRFRFFTIFVLHKSWDATPVPMRKFDSYMPYVQSQSKTLGFISTISDLKLKTMIVLMYFTGLHHGEVRHLRYEDTSRKNMRIHITHGKKRSDCHVILSKNTLYLLCWSTYGRLTGWLPPPGRPKTLIFCDLTTNFGHKICPFSCTLKTE